MLQDELEGEAKRLRREVQATTTLQMQLRDKEHQLQRWEYSARHDSEAAARMATEAKLAAEVRPPPYACWGSLCPLIRQAPHPPC